MALPTNRDRDFRLPENVDSLPANPPAPSANDEVPPVTPPAPAPVAPVAPPAPAAPAADPEPAVVEPPVVTPEPPAPVTPPALPVKPVVDQLYKDSSKQANILNQHNKVILNTIDDATNIPVPTDEEVKEYVRAQGGDFDDLSDFEKNNVRQTVLNNKRFAKISTIATERKALDDWAIKIDEFTADEHNLQKYTKLAGHERDFAIFCMQKENMGIDLNILAKSFLFDFKPDIKKKSLAMTPSSAGGAPPVADGFMDADEVKRLRTNEPRKYREMLRKGQIKLRQ